jgi:putative thioredoxin
MDSETIAATTAETFDADVVEASATQPVVVDFWAPWCGPCHQLSPILERVAERHRGEVRVVKLNVDEAPAISQRYGIRGIPAVKAFRDGEVVAEFTGVQPEQAVASFMAALVPSAADRLVARAAEAEPERREGLLREALAAEAGHRDAVVALARLLLDRGDDEEARQLLGQVPPDEEVRRLLAEIDLAGAQAEDLDSLRTAVAAGDAGAALRLGRALAAAGEHEAALAELLVAVRDPASRDAARETVLAVFAVLGDEHDLVRTYRPKLAAALF